MGVVHYHLAGDDCAHRLDHHRDAKQVHVQGTGCLVLETALLAILSRALLA